MTTVEQPLATRSFEEMAPEGHTRTVFHIDNPLQLKASETQLSKAVHLCQEDRRAWIDAQMKKMLPGWVYRLSQKAAEAKTPQEAAQKIKKVGEYMESERIEICHPQGRSLKTYIYHRKKPVAEYELRLDTR